MCLVFNKKGNKYEKNTYAFVLLSVLLYPYILLVLTYSILVLKDPVTLYQVGAFEQTLSNFIAALTLEDIQMLHDFLFDILKGSDREGIFIDFQTDMQEKGLWGTVAKLCLFLTGNAGVNTKIREYAPNDQEECDIVEIFLNVRTFLKKHPKYIKLFQHDSIDFSQMENRRLSIPLTPRICAAFVASLSGPILCYAIPGTPQPLKVLLSAYL